MNVILGGIWGRLIRKYVETRCMEYGSFIRVLLTTIFGTDQIMFVHIDSVAYGAPRRQL
jgi:hypothetical protein